MPDELLSNEDDSGSSTVLKTASVDPTPRESEIGWNYFLGLLEIYLCEHMFFMSPQDNVTHCVIAAPPVKGQGCLLTLWNFPGSRN